MTTPAPNFSSAGEYRDLNRRMADAILEADPAPYSDDGYVRRVVAIRGRRSGDVHRVPLAVISTAGHRYIVSPVRDRNWVVNLIADPNCTVLSRNFAEACVAVPVTGREDIAQVVQLYLSLMNAPWAVAQFPFPEDAEIQQIRDAAPQVAVFRLTFDETAS